MTGGAGFIGRYCVKSFLDKNFEVTVFDNFSNSSENSISDLLERGAKLIKGDITEENEVSNAMFGHDVVIHLAAKNSVEYSIKFPDETFSTNVNGTKNILNSCLKHNIESIVATSSAAVYGKTKKILATENQKPESSSPYGESKLKMEQLIQDYSKKYNLNSIILRIFNVYGKGQSPEYAGVITKFLEQISKNQSLKIFGDGLQTRDFVSINDVVKSIHLALSNIDGKQGSVYNIGSGKSISIKDLAEYIISVSGKNLDIKHKDEKKGEIRFSQADISLAKKDLDYNPEVELYDGIKNLLKIL